MRQTIGMLMQLACLVFLPMLIIWQLDFGGPLILVPACLTVATVVFLIGTRLRQAD